MPSDAGLLDRLEAWVERYRFGLRLGEQGRVASVGDGIAWVYGLPSAGSEEILRFGDGSRGLVFELQRERLGAILLDPAFALTSGSLVLSSRQKLEIAVGDALLGRVVDPLGKPLDGLAPPETQGFAALEMPSPPIVARDAVTRPLYTGVKVLDALIPVGRGQRQLIIGDAGTGKTSLALDVVIGQAGQRVKCVYVLIGQRRSAVSLALDLLRRHGALAHTAVVVAEATATPGMKYLAPFAGCAVAEGWMRQGEDTLVVYDDLSTHARAYRELSLLMRRPPGREAYPGDIFYLHSRLLERSTQLAARQGGGSMTALPIVETEQGDIAAYIPTNLISITDGQTYLDRRLFSAGVLPAVDVTRSVSRIGGRAQHPRIRDEASGMKLDYLQFHELEVFSRFGTKLEAGMAAKLRRGQLLRELLKQERLAPLPAASQLAWMTAYNAGLFDDVAPEALPRQLGKLFQRAGKSSLHLDAGRDEWQRQVRAWLGTEP
jgi:F-type H+-transporting ATPase subunit alpha